METASLRIKFTPLIKDVLNNNSKCCLEIVPEVTCIQNLEKIEWKQEKDSIEYTVPMTYKIILRKRKSVKDNENVDLNKTYHSCVDLLPVSSLTCINLASGDVTRMISDTFIFTNLIADVPNNIMINNEEVNPVNDIKEAITNEDYLKLRKPGRILNELTINIDKQIYNGKRTKIDEVVPNETHFINVNDVGKDLVSKMADFNTNSSPLCKTTETESVETIAEISTEINSASKEDSLRKLSLSPIFSINTNENPIYNLGFPPWKSIVCGLFETKKVTEANNFYNEKKTLDLIGIQHYKEQKRELPGVKVARFIKKMETEIFPLKVILNDIMQKCTSLGLFNNKDMNTLMYKIVPNRQKHVVNYCKTKREAKCNRVVYSIVFDGMMDNETVVEQIVKSLSFEVVALDGVQLTSTSKSTPLNVKIRLRKENEAGLKYGVLSEPKVDGRDNTPENIRFASSDHTIVSFNVTMEADFEKSPQKSGICTGAPNTKNYYPYLNVKTGVIEGTGHSERGLKNKFTLSKTEDNSNSKAIVVSKKNKDIFGKCKPGGCLDPPFSEEKYSYKLAKETLSPKTQDEVNKIKTSSIFKNNLFKRKKKSDIDHVADIHVSKEAVDIDSTSSLYQAGRPSKTYSNSIITYPPTLTLSEKRIKEERHASNKFSKEDKSKLSFNEDSGSYFMMTKKTKDLLDQNIVNRNSDFHDDRNELNFVKVEQEIYTTKKKENKNDELPQFNASQKIPSDSETADEDAIFTAVSKTDKVNLTKNKDISVMDETNSKLLVSITNELKFVALEEGKHTTKEQDIKDDELTQINILQTKPSVPEVADADALSIDVSKTDKVKLKEYEDILTINQTDSKLLVPKTNELKFVAVDQGKCTTMKQEIKDDELTQFNILRTKPSVPEVADADTSLIDISRTDKLKLKEYEHIPVVNEFDSNLLVPKTIELKFVAADQEKDTARGQEIENDEVSQPNILRIKPSIPEVADSGALSIDVSKPNETKLKEYEDIPAIIETIKSDNSLTGGHSPIADIESVESDDIDNEQLESNLAKEILNIKPLNDTDYKNKIPQNLNGSYDLIHQTSIAHELISSPEHFEASIDDHSVINRDFKIKENSKIVGKNNEDLIQQPYLVIVKEKSTLQAKLSLDSQISLSKTSKGILISDSKNNYENDPKFLQTLDHDSISRMEKIQTVNEQNIRSDRESIIDMNTSNIETSKIANFESLNNQRKHHTGDGLATKNGEKSYVDASREKSFIDLITKYPQPRLEPVECYAKENTPENNEANVISNEKNKQYDGRSKENIAWLEHDKTDDLKHIWQNKKAPSISEADFHMNTSILTKQPNNTDNLEPVKETELKPLEKIIKNSGLGLSDKVPRFDTEYLSDKLSSATGTKPKPFAETKTDKIDKALPSDKMDMFKTVPDQESIVSSEPKPVTRVNNDFIQEEFSIIPGNKRQSVDVYDNGFIESAVNEQPNRSLEEKHHIELKVKKSPDVNANNESHVEFFGKMAEATQIKQFTMDENTLIRDKINSSIILDWKKDKKSSLDSLKPTKTKLQLISSKDYNNDVKSGKMKASNVIHPIDLTDERILTQRSKDNIDLTLFNIDSIHVNKNPKEIENNKDVLVSSENSQSETLFDGVTAKPSLKGTVEIHPEATVNEQTLQRSECITVMFDSDLEQDKLQSDILKKVSYENLLPTLILKKDVVPIKIDVAFKTYLDENNGQVIKSFDCDNIPDRSPNDTVIIAKCYLGNDSNEIKIPVNSKKDLCIQIKRSQSRPLTELKENVLEANKKQGTANTLKGTRDPSAKIMDYENVNESEVNKCNKMINDEIRDALIAIYEQELIPLQDIIKGLRHDIDNLAACQLMFKKSLSLTSKRSRILRLREVTKKCGCFKRL